MGIISVNDFCALFSFLPSEMTYIVSGGALNSTHSLTLFALASYEIHSRAFRLV